jgi:hypothetical protein
MNSIGFEAKSKSDRYQSMNEFMIDLPANLGSSLGNELEESWDSLFGY